MDADRLYDALGKRIRALRKAVGQTQDQLAKQVGISRASLANIEAGRQHVLVHHLVRLAEALQLDSPADLLLVPQKGAQSARATTASLPLSGEGLTEKQRREVLRLMGDVMNNQDPEGSEDA